MLAIFAVVLVLTGAALVFRGRWALGLMTQITAAAVMAAAAAVTGLWPLAWLCAALAAFCGVGVVLAFRQGAP